MDTEMSFFFRLLKVFGGETPQGRTDSDSVIGINSTRNLAPNSTLKGSRLESVAARELKEL
jgi:hypothetical protein